MSLPTDVEALWEMGKPQGRGPGAFQHMCAWYSHNSTECCIIDKWVTTLWNAAQMAWRKINEKISIWEEGGYWKGGGGRLIEKDSLNFEFGGGLKTRGRCERMWGSWDKGPACPSLAVRGPQENRGRLGPFYKRGLEEWRKGGREESEWGGGF